MKQNLLYSFIFLFSQFLFSQTVMLDNTFGTNGKVLHSFEQNGDGLNAISIQQDGKVLVCTLKEFSLNGNVIVSRFNVDGTLDTNFGVNGIVETQLIVETMGYNLIKLQPDGKILVVGSKSNTSNLNHSDFAAMRYNPDGTVDTDFGTNGIVITDFNSKDDVANAVALQSDGKIIVAGFTYSDSNGKSNVSLVRYLNNGTIDSAFGDNGKSVLPGMASNSHDFSTCIQVTQDNHILIGATTTAGEIVEDDRNVAVFKVNNDGTMDTSFNTTGYAVLDFGADEYIGAIDEYDGKIVIAGYSGFTGGAKFFLARFTVNGTPDPAFGVNGLVIGNRNSTNTHDAVIGMKILDNGKLLCTGYTLNDTNADFLLIQFNNNGTIDSGFNNSGYFMTDFNNGTNDISSAIAIAADGKIVCSGFTELNAIRVTSLARYTVSELSNGSFTSKSFTVYPNPFSESVTIQSENVNIANITVELFDIGGRKLSTYKPNAASGFLIPMHADLVNGNYFLRITADNQTSTIKIIKK